MKSTIILTCAAMLLFACSGATSISYAERQSNGLQVERASTATYAISNQAPTRGTTRIASRPASEPDEEVVCFQMCDRFAQCAFISFGEVERCMHNCGGRPHSNVTLDLNTSCTDLSRQMRGVR